MYRKIIMIMISLLFQQALVARAAHIAIDGAFADWAGEVCFPDPGLADDETSPATADVTEFCISAESGNLYILKAWDDTSFQGGNETTAAVTVRGADSNYYRIYATATSNPGSVPTDSLVINTCGTDPACTSETEVCDNTDGATSNDCTGASAGSSTSWDDPWGGRGSPACRGTDCSTKDTAGELEIPWTLAGGEPADGQAVFLDFASYPSGPGRGEKDVTGPNGITCENQAGTFVCFPSSPTAVTFKSFQASSLSPLGPWLFFLLALAGIGAMVRIFFRHRRKCPVDE